MDFMNWLNNVSVKVKVFILMIIALIAVSLVAGSGYHFLKQSNERADEMYGDRLLPVKQLNENRSFARAIEGDILALMLAKDPALRKDLADDIGRRAAAFDKNFQDYKATKLDPFEAEAVPKLEAALQKYRAVRGPVIEMTNQGRTAEAFEVYEKQLRPIIGEFNKHLGDLAEYNAKTAKELAEANEQGFKKAQMVAGAIWIGALLVLAFFGWGVARAISVPAAATANRLGIMAEGDYSKDIIASFLARRDEFGKVAKAFDSLNRNMRGMIRQVSNSAQQVAASSQELTASAQQSAEAANNVASSIQQVAMGSEKQVSAVNETSAVVQEISATLEEVAATANEMATMAEKTARATQAGQTSVDRAVNQMSEVGRGAKDAQKAAEELKAGSRQIGEIVGLISSIAGQTNLLALNAAIEAARAGEAGRGFAVVAEEVRKLAEQSEGAAQQITELIGRNNTNIGQVVGTIDKAIGAVDQGVELVNVAGGNFREIGQLVKQVAAQVGDISTALQEAAVGSQRIVASIKDVENLSRDAAAESQNVSAATEEQSASMEQIAASSQALAKLAQELQLAVAKFKI